MTDPSKLPRGVPPRLTNPLGFVAVRDPRTRIGVLAALLLLVVFGMIFLWQFGKSAPARDESGAPSIELAPPAPEGVPALDTRIADQLTDYGPEAQSRWPVEAVRYLLIETANTPAVFYYSKNLLPLTAGSAAEIAKDSRPWRFKYVRFRGEVEGEIEDEEYEAVYGSPAPVGRVCRGRVRIADGDPPVRVLFITAHPPKWADPNLPGPPETEMIVDGWVRGRGILVQNYLDERGGGVPTLLVVATKIERDYDAVAVTSLKDIPFDIIQDDRALGDDQETRGELWKEYPKALYRLVRYAEQFAGPEGAEARAKAELKPASVGHAKDWEAMVGKPRDSRGKYCGGKGVVVVSPHRFLPETIEPNDAGVEECLNGWVYTDERRLIQAIMPGSLSDLPKNARVRWEGFFYKMKLYAANDGTEKFAPVFVLTVLDEVRYAKGGTLFPVILAGSVVLAMLVLAWIVLKEDGTKENYRRIRQKEIASSRVEK